MTTEKADQVIAHANAVFTRLDQRKGAVRDAATRERQRLNAGFGRVAGTVAATIVFIWVAAVVIGLIQPIGMFGFVAAIVATAVAIGLLIARFTRQQVTVPAPAADLPNGQMVERFDSYIFRTRRALPAPAQAEIDALAAVLPSLKQTLERVDTLDPNAQDARRLMSLHLPGLIDRYMHVPTAYRGEEDGEGKTADERLVEALAASRSALGDISEKLARADIAALETQGRFIESRYGQEQIDSSADHG
jgi:hypothetical protein